jgi:adenylate cyclase
MEPKGFHRKLTAIFSADVAGYSRLMEDDEAATVKTLEAYKQIISGLIKQYRGRVVDSPGDNLLAEFASVVDAVQCGVAVQKELQPRNNELPEIRRMKFRIGINLGDVIEEEGRIYGDGVNIASRVESTAEAGGICISGSTYDQVENKLGQEYAYLGEHQVKNIKKPVRIYRVMMESVTTLPEENPVLPFPDKPSIAVLPFVNMSGDSEQKYFSDGITEDIITALSRSPWLFVISRNSSFAYQGKQVDIRQVSRELGVRYVLEGSVRKKGNHVRVTAQLIDGAIGSHVWAEKYDSDLQDIFELQDQISSQVVASILTQIQIHAVKKVKRLECPDGVTWDLLARGWKLYYELTKESLASAEKIFRRAVESAPTSCDAHHLLAGVLIHEAFMNYVSEREAYISEAYEFANRAIVLDEQNEYAHWIMGVIQNHRGKHDLAIAELKRAIELNPSWSLAYGSLGTVLYYIGEPDEAIKNIELAIRLNPRDPSIFFRYSALAMAHFVAGRYLEATQWARKSVQRKPIWRTGHAVLASSLAHLNRLEEAKAAVGDYLENIPGATISKLLENFLFPDPKYPRLLAEGLRKAGLPE